MLTLNIGFNRKSGEPNYGSRGASVNLQLELDSGLILDPERLQERIRFLFGLAKASVEEELRGNQANGSTVSAAATNGHPTGQANGNGQRASSRQIEYAQKLASQVRGLGTSRLEALTKMLFCRALADLTSTEASGLIDRLRALKAGEIDVQSALDGATATAESV